MYSILVWCSFGVIHIWYMYESLLHGLFIMNVSIPTYNTCLSITTWRYRGINSWYLKLHKLNVAVFNGQSIRFSSKLEKTLMLNITRCIYILIVYNHKINICVIHLWLNPRLKRVIKPTCGLCYMVFFVAKLQ